ncbi:YopB/SseC family type III secretion system translocon subunit [Escherichia coli]|uniref:YopB/SseC family type III secretion system translocon subunit n=1 Tax=Escherichia coli TaxID=562 RepID=UPI00069B589C|nr:YopB/SseC family type III secretion system translocon subunit [Escherichia coli]EFH5777387.1 YopB/SseC family type III secretion system translocon subunit [Escherichia coli]EFH7405133.1 YopB/SseC family type III secretion system translocon subunit [Escherichia coli]EFJ7468819.1 YopB/SseC family type III secretion system translocon subunit [Escherichia coli]EFK3425990.1 YopB/SseC family type III secretion system translocon subunit [Escherichia coli]EFN8887386.1 secretion protein EspD [Escher
MLETKSDILSTTSGANSTTFISDITQSERTSTLDFQLVKSSVASVSKADTGILPVPPAGHALVTPSAAEDILSKLFGGISGDVISRTGETESQSSTRSTTGYPYLSQVNNVDPQAMMMMATLLSLDASAQRVASMKNSNEIYTDGQNKALDNKTLEFKKQLEEQQKAEEKAQKSKIVGQVFGWLGVAATAIAAIFNPALWAVVAISATAMALQTAVDVMGDNAPQALKTAAQAFGGLSLAAGILTAGIGGVSSLISKVGDVANKVGSNIVKVVTTLADTFVENVASKISAVANGLTTSSRSIGTTVLNNDAAYYNVLSQVSAFAVENLTRQSEYLSQSAKAELEKATLELQNQANYIQSASQLMSDSARVNSRIVNGRV